MTENCDVRVRDGVAPVEGRLGDTKPLDRASVVLFDFNGTLAADEPVIAETVVQIARDMLGVELSVDDYFTRFAGLTEHAMFTALVGGAHANRGGSHGVGTGVSLPGISELVAAFTERYIARTYSGAYILPDTRALVAELHARGTVLGLVTAASRAMVIPALRGAGIEEAFRVIVTLDDVAEPKPHPEAYVQALEHLGCDAHRAVAVEDSSAGLSAARSAGIRTIAVAGTAPSDTLRELSAHVVDRLTIEMCLSAPALAS